MAKTPKPWLRKGRGWFVTIGGKQHNLGRDKKAAFQEYYRLMQRSPERQRVSGASMAAIIDDFLEYLSKNRASDTYRWYRDLLQKFIVLNADLRKMKRSLRDFSDQLKESGDGTIAAIYFSGHGFEAVAGQLSATRACC